MNSRPRELFAPTAVCVALAMSVTACAGEQGTRADDGGPIRVATSTNVWGSVVQAVGGQKVSVEPIINDPSADPHSYESTPEDATKVTDAKLLVSNGGGYDEFFDKLAGEAEDARKLVAFDISGKGDGGGHEHGHEHGGGGSSAGSSGGGAHRHGGNEHGEANEHVWYDLSTVGSVADQVATQLGELMPEAKGEFRSNADAFTGKLAELIAKAEQIGARNPGRKVVATEPVAHYLLDAAKVDDVTPPEFAEAIEEESEIPVAAQDQVNQLLAGKQVDAVLDNAQTATPVTEQLHRNADNAGLPVVGVTETLPAGVTDYLTWMGGQVDALAGALSRK